MRGRLGLLAHNAAAVEPEGKRPGSAHPASTHHFDDAQIGIEVLAVPAEDVVPRDHRVAEVQVDVVLRAVMRHLEYIDRERRAVEAAGGAKPIDDLVAARITGQEHRLTV